jgi:hypothetical protein
LLSLQKCVTLLLLPWGLPAVLFFANVCSIHKHRTLRKCIWYHQRACCCLISPLFFTSCEWTLNNCSVASGISLFHWSKQWTGQRYLKLRGFSASPIWRIFYRRTSRRPPQ